MKYFLAIIVPYVKLLGNVQIRQEKKVKTHVVVLHTLVHAGARVNNCPHANSIIFVLIFKSIITQVNVFYS